MEEFIKVSRKLGRDITLAQGPGGNSSIKTRNLMYIKASGTKLKDISKKSDISCVKFDPVKRGLQKNKMDERQFLKIIADNIVTKKSFGSPSMETGFHAVIPSKYVLHLHSLYSNILSSSTSGKLILEKVLSEFDYIVIDYVNPGFELAKVLLKQKDLPQLIILRNHGIIVHGNKIEDCLTIVKNTNKRMEDYLKSRKVLDTFKVSKKTNSTKHIFPDSAVLGSKNDEIERTNSYIIESIKKLNLKPRYLMKKEINKLLSMEQEKYRQNLNGSTQLVVHRVNKIADLKKIPKEYGTEIDIRESGGKLILNHEPFGGGDLFEKYLKNYKHGLLILNIKEAGIESRVLKLVRKYKMKDYFLLDVEAPYLYRASREGVHNIAVRYSEVEPIETLEYYRGYVDWVWIDTVSTLPLDEKVIEKMRGFKTALVCPERWGRPEDIPVYRKKMKDINFEPDVVMTALSTIPAWEK